MGQLQKFRLSRPKYKRSNFKIAHENEASNMDGL